MNRFVRTNFLIIVILFLIVFSAPQVFAVSWLPLVPCGVSEKNETDFKAKGQGDPNWDYSRSCTRCDTFRLADNVIDFILIGFIPPVAAILFIVAGLMIVLAGANQKLYSTGITIFKSTFWGLVIILASWMITNTFLKSFAPAQADAPWYRLTCKEGKIRVGGPPPPVPVPTTSQKAAQELISTIGLNSFSVDADCGNNFHARQNIQDIVAGRLPNACSSDCLSRPLANRCPAGGSSGNVNVSPLILNGLTRLAKERRISFMVTSLTTGIHAPTSAHYGGNAVDIVLTNKTSSVWIEVRAVLESYGGDAMCEIAGREIPNCDNFSSGAHIHWRR